jgi:predicted enzyme related to lactoylglutathione lyase
MSLIIHNTLLPADDPEKSLVFWRDAVGFEVRNDVGYGGMRWITLGPPEQPQTSIVLHPPTADPGLTDAEKRTIAQLMAKGSYALIVLGTPNVDETFERVQATGADVVQEPMDQPYGVRDCAFRDPAGNMVRINQLS